MSILYLIDENGNPTPIPSLQGEPGKSAYQSYLDTGGTLSEAEWIASLRATAPEFVDSVDQMTDPKRVYVLTTSMGGVSYTNLYDASTAIPNVRINSSGETVDCTGVTTTDFIPCKRDDCIRIQGFDMLVDVNDYFYLCAYNSNKEFIHRYMNISSQTGIAERIDDTNVVYKLGLIDSENNEYFNGSSEIAYMRICGVVSDNAIITVNEEIIEFTPAEAGMIYTYGTKEITTTPTNLFDISTARLNRRINSSGVEIDELGAAIFPDLPFVAGDVLRINRNIDGEACRIVVRGANEKLYMHGGAAYYYYPCEYTEGTTTVTIGQLLNTFGDAGSGIRDLEAYIGTTIASINFVLYMQKTELTEADIADIVITKNEPLVGSTQTVTGWHSTGMAYIPADYEPRIIELENAKTAHDTRLTNVETRLTALESGTTETNTPVPAYWQDAIDGLKGRMETVQTNGNDCFQFVWFADFHGKQAQKTDSIGVVCQRVCEQYNIPLVAVAGDIMSQASHTNVESVHTEYVGVNEVFAAIDADKLLATIGNHDGAWGAPVEIDGVQTYYLKDIGNRALYNKIFRRQATDLRRVFGPDGTYFYLDSHPQKIRVVMLNAHTDGDGSSDTNGYAVYNSMKHFVLGTEQLAWLQDQALDVPEGWGIVLMAHPPIDPYISDKTLLSGIIAAYNGRTAYAGGSVNVSADYWGNGLDSPYNTSTAAAHDYTNAGGEIIAYFHGHIHKDNISSVAGIPMISITTAGGDVRDTAYTVDRVSGSATETAMDIVTIDRAAREIYMTRLGAGLDREVEY